MAIRILYSENVVGKRNQIIDEIVQIQRKSENRIIYIVPQQYSFESEKLLTRATGNKGFMQIQVLSFMRLGYTLANEVGGCAKSTMNSLGKTMLLYDTYRKHQGEFEVFNIATNKAGFTDVTENLFAEFKRNQLSPADVRGLGKYFEKDSMQEKKFDEIGRLFELYEERVLENNIDQEDMINLLIENIPLSKEIKDCYVWIDGYNGLTVQQLAVVRALAGVAKEVTIGITADYYENGMDTRDIDIFSSTKELGNKIYRLACEIGQPCIAEEVDSRWHAQTKPELKAFRNNVLKVSNVVYQDEVKNIKVEKALNAYEECVWVAREIVELIKTEEYRFEDVAVVCPSVDRYSSLLRSVFESFGIRYYMDLKPKLNNNVLIRFIVGVLRIMSGSWRLEDVLGVLKMGLLPVKAEEVDRLEEYVVANNIRGSKWYQDEAWAFKFGVFGDRKTKILEQLEEIDSIRKRAVLPIRELHEKILGGKPANEIAEAIYDFLIEQKIDLKAKAYNDEFFRDAWNWIIEVLDQLAFVFGGEKLSSSKVYDMFSIAFAQVEGAMVPMKRDVVIVGDVNRSRLHEKKALFIMNVVEDEMPKVQTVEGVITDEERELLRENGVPLAASLKKRMWENRVDLFTMFSVPTQKLFLSYSILKLDGTAVRPSTIIKKIERIFPKVHLGSFVEDYEISYSTQTDLFNQLVARINDRSPEIDMLFKYYEGKEEAKNKVIALKRGLKFNGEIQRIDAKKMREAIGDELNSSITKLESYARCHYSYFINHILKVRELESYSFNAMDIGNVSHRILELYFKFIKENDVEGWSRDDSDKKVNEIISKEYNFEKVNNSYKDNAEFLIVFAYVKSMIMASCWYCHLSFVNSSFEFKEFEKYVEKEYKIDVEGQNSVALTIRGVIDRVDSFLKDDKEYIRVIDYKTGEMEFDYGKAYLGVQLQLMCYLKILVEQSEKFQPSALLYQRIHNEKIRTTAKNAEAIDAQRKGNYEMSGVLLEDEDILKAMDRDFVASGVSSKILKKAIKRDEMENLLCFAEEKLRKLSEELMNGHIEAAPYKYDKKTGCSFCDYKPVCGFDEGFRNCKYNEMEKMSKKSFFEMINNSNKEKE